MLGSRCVRTASIVSLTALLLVGVACEARARAIDDGVLKAVYAEGMKAFYAGRYAQAHDNFTQAIEAGFNDPRAFYFRGLANLRLGRAPDAKLDFTRGAEIESADFDLFFNVSGSLERIQGSERLLLEQHRAAGRKLAVKERERIRFELYRRFAPEQAVEGAATIAGGAAGGSAPATGAATGAAPTGTPAPAATSPFDAPAASPFAPATPAPSTPTAPATPAAPPADPFGTPAPTAPAPAPATPPAPAAPAPAAPTGTNT